MTAARTRYPTVTLAEVASIKGGKRLPANAELVREPTSHPYIRGRDIRNGTITFDDPVYVADDTYQKICSYIVRAGDICITIVGNIGDVGVVPPSLDGANLTENAVKLVDIESGLDSQFLAYALQAPGAQNQMKLAAAGAAQPKLGIYKVSEVRVPLPPIGVQRTVVEILSVYDALIENSQRRMRILEEMARALYREWFVEFRFPGHDHGKMSERSGVPVPVGWDLVPMPKCVDINPRISVPKGVKVDFVPMSALANDCMLITEFESRAAGGGSKFQNGDTLFARITPCLENGKTGFVQFLPSPDAVAMGSTEFIVLRSHSLTPEFVYCLARSEEVRNAAIASMSGASGRQRVQEKCFDTIQVACPPSELLDRFSAIVVPSFKLIQNLFEQSQRLRKARDLLLPRLLAGMPVAA